VIRRRDGQNAGAEQWRLENVSWVHGAGATLPAEEQNGAPLVSI